MKKDTRNYGKFHQGFFKGGRVLPEPKPDISESAFEDEWNALQQQQWRKDIEPELERKRKDSVIREADEDWRNFTPTKPGNGKI